MKKILLLLCLAPQILEAQVDTTNVLDEVLVVAKKHNSLVSETRAQLEGLSKISDIAESLTSAQAKGSAIKNSLIVLNKGSYEQNNASLVVYDIPTVEVKDVFYETNGIRLGDTAQDFIRV
jgi:hypothetical protein